MVIGTALKFLISILGIVSTLVLLIQGLVSKNNTKLKKAGLIFLGTCITLIILGTIEFLILVNSTKSTNEPDRTIRVLKALVVDKGDKEAYEELETAYLDFPHGQFYEIAKIMADKYNYPQAYYDVYIQLLKPTNNSETTISLDSCTEEEIKEAISYLKKAFAKGFEPAGKELEELKQQGYIE